jgi:hypothetical protein
MAESLAFNNYWDIGFSNSLLYAPSEKTFRNVKEERAPYIVASGIAATADTWALDELVLEFQELIARTQIISELDIPDVFTLRPLATQRITLKIREIKPAKFYYVKDIDDDEE